MGVGVSGRFISEEALLTLAGPAEVKEGTILARDSVSQKLRLYVKGGATNENGIPKAVLAHNVVSTFAGQHDVSVSGIVSGRVSRRELMIHADGDDSNIDAKVLDQLRDYGLVAVQEEC